MTDAAWLHEIGPGPGFTPTGGGASNGRHGLAQHVFGHARSGESQAVAGSGEGAFGEQLAAHTRELPGSAVQMPGDGTAGDGLSGPGEPERLPFGGTAEFPANYRRSPAFTSAWARSR